MENKSQTIVLSLKYVLLAILTGVLVGIIDTVFGRGLFSDRPLFVSDTVSAVCWSFDHMAVLSFQRDKLKGDDISI